MGENRTKENERKKPRFKVHIQDTKQMVKIIDISSTGCHIETANKYHLGDMCNLSINLRDSAYALSLTGKVVWGKLMEKKALKDKDNFEYGIAFKSDGDMDSSKIVDLIMKHIDK